MTLSWVTLLGLYATLYLIEIGVAQRQISPFPASSNGFPPQRPSLQPVQLRAQQRPSVPPRRFRTQPPPPLLRRPLTRIALRRRSPPSKRDNPGISNRKPTQIIPAHNISHTNSPTLTSSDNRPPMRAQASAERGPPLRPTATSNIPPPRVPVLRQPPRLAPNAGAPRPSPIEVAPSRGPTQRPMRRLRPPPPPGMRRPPQPPVLVRPQVPQPTPSLAPSRASFPPQTSSRPQPQVARPIRPRPIPQLQTPSGLSGQQASRFQRPPPPAITPPPRTFVASRPPTPQQLSSPPPVVMQPRPPPTSPSPPPRRPAEQRFTRPEDARVLPPSAPVGPPRPAPLATNAIDDINNNVSPPPQRGPSAHPPGFLPPSNSVVDELNNSLNFFEVARRLQLRRVIRGRARQ